MADAERTSEAATSGAEDAYALGRANYEGLDKGVRDGLDEILYAEHMGDVIRGVKRLAVSLGLPEPVCDDSLWNGYEWPWLVEPAVAPRGDDHA